MRKFTQKLLSIFVFIGLCLTFMQLLAQDSQESLGLLWQCDFRDFDEDQWVWNRSQPEAMKDALRVRVIPGAQGNYATFHTTVPTFAEDTYLQVFMGDMEDIAAKPWIRSASSGGASFGNLFRGWNTFSMQENAGRRFALSFGQLGNKALIGPWVDYELVRVVKKPTNGLIVSCLGKTAKDALQVGDELLVEYYAETALPDEKLQMNFFLYPQMLEYPLEGEKFVLLADDGKNGDRQAGDLIYSAKVKITADAFDCHNDKKTKLMGGIKILGNHSYFTVANALEIKTNNLIPKALASAGNLQTRQDRQLWYDRAKGKNLALGKTLQLAPQPDYRLTKDENDVRDLTDGKLSNRKDDKIWFDKQAVGWYMGNGIAFIKLDIGKVEDVDRLLIRCLGGTIGNFQFPKTFEVYVSKDDEYFHLARRMQKLMPGESSQSDFKEFYYLEEEGSKAATRMYPFELSIQAEARFVLLKITGTSGSIFSDEMAVFKAESKAKEFNLAYENPRQIIPLEGLLIRPRLEKLDLIKNIPAPQSFEIMDLREDTSANENLQLVLDLPPGLKILSPEFESKDFVIDNVNYSRYELALNSRANNIISPTIYLEAAEDFTAKLPAFCMARCAGIDQFRSTLPITIMEIPEIPRFKRLHVSLSWMGEGQGKAWPDFFNQWEKLGFNVVSTFPRFWRPERGIHHQEFVADAKARGYKIIMNDSAFHEMMRGHKEGSEIFCDIPGQSHRMLCPSYRGKFYDKEMERVENCVKIGKPDYVFYDIECWTRMRKSAVQCLRCQEALKKSGKALDDFLLDCLAENMKNLDAAVHRGAEAVGIPVPIQGDYNRHALSGMNYFQMIYPEYISMAMPSLYVAGRAVDVHKTIRSNHLMLNTRQIIPWLSAGTYGEFPPPHLENMVLEALMNGANGITYYKFADFSDSPFDFYYHARALAMLRPYEDLIMDGKPLQLEGSNDEMFYSAIEENGKMLLLTGNYYNSVNDTEFEFPWPVKKILDLQNNKALPASQKTRYTVPKSSFRLFYVERK